MSRAVPDCVDGFPVDEVAGYRDHTTARSTGTLVILAVTAEFGLNPDDGGRWVTVCDPHGGICQHERVTDARGFMRHPEQWCPSCQDDAASLAAAAGQ